MAFEVCIAVYLYISGNAWRQSKTNTFRGLLQVVRMVVSTYQAASGAGAAAMEELELQTREVVCFYWNHS